MSPKQFTALAELMRLGPDTPRGRALRAVLCNGVRVATAARDEEIASPAVYRALDRAEKVIELAQSLINEDIKNTN